jgi:hypothetical protein
MSSWAVSNNFTVKSNLIIITLSAVVARSTRIACAAKKVWNLTHYFDRKTRWFCSLGTLGFQIWCLNHPGDIAPGI